MAVPHAALPLRGRTPLARRRRASARLALYLSLALVLAAAVGLLAWLTPGEWRDGATDWRSVDFAAMPEIQLLQEYIAIDTSDAPGQLAGARWFADRLAALGLEPVVDRVGEEANLWAIVEGESREAVVLHHHIDVEAVPNIEAWRVSPFRGTIEGPWLYGRGAFDMKSVAIAQLEAVRALLGSGRRPRRSVIVLATTGEEVGSDFGTRWVLRRHPELIERFAVVLTEGGAVEARSPEEIQYWGTEVAQVRVLRVDLCSGSREALVELERDLVGLGLESEPRLVPEIERVLGAYALTRHGRQGELLSRPRRLLADRAAFRELPLYVRSFFVDLVVPHGVRPAAGGGHELALSLLLLPGTDPAEAVERLLPSWVRHGFAVRMFDEGAAGHGSPGEHWAFAALDRTVRESFPDAVHGPLYLPSTATDARFFRTMGVPTYGFTPFNVLTPEVLEVRRSGSINERIGLSGFVAGVELYRRALARLANDTERNAR
jgi:acetylornithine deacetylase/succinyl-diaminopimelate desuccinylase-like protein